MPRLAYGADLSLALFISGFYLPDIYVSMVIKAY